MKHYDREYFERWYRRSDVGVGQREFVTRKVLLAVAAAEFVLGRRIASVLDVGCGEGLWRAPLRRLRPGVAYAGFDSSEYAIARFGRTRNLKRAGLADMASQRLAKAYDLVVCADVMHYVSEPEVRAGLKVIAKKTRGAAFVEAFTNADAIDGDHDHFQDRSPARYRRLFAEAGLVPLGLHLYVTKGAMHTLTALEQGAAGAVR
ncbi:MAG: class I SAM-dependent methyltransferase [Candidatus Eisenbacteria bacterium]